MKAVAGADLSAVAGDGAQRDDRLRRRHCRHPLLLTRRGETPAACRYLGPALIGQIQTVRCKGSRKIRAGARSAADVHSLQCVRWFAATACESSDAFLLPRSWARRRTPRASRTSRSSKEGRVLPATAPTLNRLGSEMGLDRPLRETRSRLRSVAGQGFGPGRSGEGRAL